MIKIDNLLFDKFTGKFYVKIAGELLELKTGSNGGGESVTVDTVPTEGSNHPISSGAVYEALQNVDDINPEDLIPVVTQDISTENGGDNIVTFTFPDGTTSQITIKNGTQGTQGNSGYTGAANELEVVNNLEDGGATAALSAEMGKELAEQSIIESGTFAKAYLKAVDVNAPFPWVLKDTDGNGNSITKMIWHIGNREFVDAAGADVNWYKDGITIITETPCVFRVTDNGTANNAIDIPLASGANNIQFSQLHPQGSTVAENVIQKGWFLKTTASAGISPSNSDKTTDILYADFGGLIVKEKLDLHGQESIKLKTIKNLVLNGTIANWNGWLNYAPYVEHIDISGTLTYAANGNKLLQFNLPNNGTPNNLTRLDLSKLNAPMYNVQHMPNLNYLDIRGMNPKKDENNYTESQYNLPMTQFVKNLSTLVIGDFDTSTYSLPSGKTLFGLVVSTDTTSGLTLVCTKSTPPANTGNAETDVIVELLTKATTILVPPNSISAYQADSVWGSANFVSKISEYNEGDY